MKVDSIRREAVLGLSVVFVDVICALYVEKSGHIDTMDVRKEGGSSYLGTIW